MRKLFFAYLQISLISAMDHKIDIRYKTTSPKLYRRYSTDGIFLAQSNISFTDVELLASRSDVEVKISGAENSYQTAKIPDEIKNRLSPRCTLVRQEVVTIPALFKNAFDLLLKTIALKDDKSLFVDVLHEQSLEEIIKLYNFCQMYQVSPEYSVAIMNALLRDVRFLKELVDNPEGNTMKGEGTTFGWQDESEAAYHFTHHYAKRVMGDPLYEESQDITCNSRIKKMYWLQDFSRLMVVTDVTLHIYLLRDGRYEEFAVVYVPQAVKKVCLNTDGTKFVVYYADKTSQLYEYTGNCYQKVVRGIQVAEQIIWDETLDTVLEVRGDAAYVEHYDSNGGQIYSTIPARFNIQKFFCDKTISTVALWNNDARILKLYEQKDDISYKSIRSKTIEGIDVKSVFASPDARDYVISGNWLGEEVTYFWRSHHDETTAIEGLQGKINQICWGRHQNYIALLLNDSDVKIYKYDDNSNRYKEMPSIPRMKEYEHAIVALFTNEDMTKIILQLATNKLVVFQKVMTSQGLRFEKTQEIQCNYAIKEMVCNKRLDHIAVSLDNQTIKLFKIKDEELSINQILFFPAFIKCRTMLEGKSYSERNKKRIAECIENYAPQYGEWLVNIWNQQQTYAGAKSIFYLMKHKKMVGCIGLGLLIPIIYLAVKYG